MRRKIQEIKSDTVDTKTKKSGHRWYHWLFEITLVLAIVIGVQTWAQRHMLSGEAPEIAQTSLDGSPLTLSQYQGEPVILHFWSTWCPLCTLEQDTITDLAQDWPLLSIATFEKTDNPEVIKQHQIEQLTAGWPTVLDKGSAIAQQYGVTGVPSTYIIDGKGVIRFKTSGYTTSWGLKLRLWLTKTFFD